MGRRALRKAVLFAVSLFLFILAIMLMKEGARGLEPVVRDVLHVTSPFNALGFGWVFAYMVMSGSPVAAAALALLDAGVLEPVSAFTMIAGSRIGASFFVLLIGFLYVARGRDRAASLGMGLLSLVVTGLTYMASLPVGILLLQTEWLNRDHNLEEAYAVSAMETFFDPIVAMYLTVAPYWTLFPAGLFVIIISFSLFDRCLPQIAVGERQMGRMSRLVFRSWFMFALGALVTLVTLSVSVSLSILVPLSHRGYIRRENAAPYIMGAGITTFVDTLVVALLLRNPSALAVVLAQMLSVSLVSIMVLAFLFGPFERTALRIVEWTTSSTRNLAVFILSIVGIPALLLVL